jgi:hypothetical protein
MGRLVEACLAKGRIVLTGLPRDKTQREKPLDRCRKAAWDSGALVRSNPQGIEDCFQGFATRLLQEPKEVVSALLVVRRTGGQRLDMAPRG